MDPFLDLLAGQYVNLSQIRSLKCMHIYLQLAWGLELESVC